MDREGMSIPYVSVRAADIDPNRLEEVLSRHIAYERLRTFRSLLVRRLGGLVLLAFLLTEGAHVLPVVALLGLAVMATATGGAAVVAEVVAKQRLTREIRGLPPAR